MKTLTVTKADYDEIVYPLVALDAVKEPAKLRVALGVLEKLEAAGERQDKGPTKCPHCSGVVEAAKAVAMYRLNDLSADFEFEDAEAEFVAERLKAGIPRLAASRARTIPGLLDMLGAA